MNTNDFNYDELVKFMEQARGLYSPEWVVSRSIEEAEAFAYWCIENGIEEPRIVVPEH